MTRSVHIAILALSASALAAPVVAQTAPDAGQVLRDVARPVLSEPAPSPDVTIQSPAPSGVQPGGERVLIKQVSFSGNTIFSDAELQGAVGDATGKTYDLAGLQGLALRVTEHYRAAGYPFARALITGQKMTDGGLTITVVEGRYGNVSATGDATWTTRAQPFLDALEPGTVIESATLERTALLLSDLPGINVAPLIRPGEDVGTGDLTVAVERDRLITGGVSLDNHGNRYNGYNRAQTSMQINSPFTLGDQISLQGLLSDKSMVLGAASYSLPLGTSGLRGHVSFAHTRYELAREFAVLDATGHANVYGTGLSYPLVRSQPFNVTLSGTAQHKDLKDKSGATGTESAKTSQTLPIALQFDRRDSLGGGAITYGVLTWTPGRLNLDSGLAAADRTTARSDGTFHKLTLDAARLQQLPAGLVLYGRFSGQLANKNLDSSENLSLGGPNGVRAYPVGEANGNEGWLTQVELRYDVAPFTPFIFYDAGAVTINANPWVGQADNSRSLQGVGAGVRVAYDAWAFDGSLAWRTRGGSPQSDIRDRRPQVWVSVGYKF